MTLSITETLISTTHKQLSQNIFTRRSIIPFQNNVLWRIDRGIVRTLTWCEDGTSMTLGYWGVGDIVGYPLSKVNPYQIECLTSVEATMIPPHLWHEDINALLNYIQQTEELISILHQKPTSLKVWKFLVWLSEKFGRDLEQGKLIDVNITHQDISEVLNTTRVTVTRILQQFEEEGKILRHKRSIVLNLPSKLTII
ncbi:Crp/Fnr family transcriptional regulator [Sphaerospermopsis aphanizomenoides BCCUSP55]|uniref:Crp/Fnr family transcriptional regulator n=1 Tax=Sphaerospermopsis aphanizomenoides TaxID=459663 RepID=UPI001903C4F9|nr:Crp/Fnr family transcriptional regulator [Sphaerospermopsis aphanizomenoides]MBK1990584.1 Crp/Fnr family transcriptional regulator [Sphaerospermopsis aphanizomenoides BCCUSP55]